MQYRLSGLALLALAGSALAHQHHQHKHAKLHDRRLASAPFAMVNSTLPVGPSTGAAAAPQQDSTVTQYSTATVHATQIYTLTQTRAQTQSAAAASAVQLQAVEVKAESAATDNVCEEITVTVTNAPVTVTVTATAISQASTPSSSGTPSSVAVAPSPFVLAGGSSTIEATTPAVIAATSVQSSPSPSATTSPSAASIEEAVVQSTTSPGTALPSVVATSTYSSATATGSSVAGVSAQRGLVYNTFSGVVDKFTSNMVSWAWNWAQTPGGSMPDGVEFVPILWGNRESDDLANWKSNAEEQISNGAKHLMGFNEPDVDSAGGGSDIAADVAASVYKNYLNGFASKATLVSPSVCNGEGIRESTGRNQGLDWLQDFHDACGGFTESGCKVDKIGIHWYTSYQGDIDSVVSYFKEYVEKSYAKFNMNLWITEYQLQNADESTQQEFISATSEWMSTQPYIDRYSYFKAETIVSSQSLMSAYSS